jgi:maltooligosyltrehalose trehalohydrolase
MTLRGVLFSLDYGFNICCTVFIERECAEKETFTSPQYGISYKDRAGRMKIGVYPVKKGMYAFRVWAPLLKSVSLKIIESREKYLAMEKDKWGYWEVVTDSVAPGTRYLYRLEDEKDRPDPASHHQPQGVHGPSEIVDQRAFRWEDEHWRGIPISEMIMYELHVGTFTNEGTFAAIIPRLNELRDIGINALEVMPVAQFPGERNWGYDGVYPFAVQNSYGGSEGLKRLVNECHKLHMAVILDVVYNHLGPEGNYLREFGPYFTDRYRTPWGESINYDGPHSNDVRNYFIENALFWLEHYHIDALRLDAVHAIHDSSARPFLQELAESVQRFSEGKGRKYHLIAESDLNDPRIIRTLQEFGFGYDAQWSDDFHHSLRTLITGEHKGYYMDFGTVDQLIAALKNGYVYSGQYSKYRKRNHGISSADIPAERFVIYSQNHDHIGNSMLGERLSGLVSFEAQKLVAGFVLLSPYIPLLFMGEEYGETSPFLYFVSHSDPDLIHAVREGRKDEFRAFQWQGEPPDPQSIDTYVSSRLTWDLRLSGRSRVLLDFYKEVIRLRKRMPALAHLDKAGMKVEREGTAIIIVHRSLGTNQIILFFNVQKHDERIKPGFVDVNCKREFDSSDLIWNGPGSDLPHLIDKNDAITIRGESFAVFVKED